MSWQPKILNQHYPILSDVEGVEGENGAIVWEVKKTVEELTMEEIAALPGRNPNYQRAREVKRLMQKNLTCTQIVIALRSRYGERAVKGDHAVLNKIKQKRTPTLRK